MASGQDVPPTPEALWIPEHLQLHMAFLNENGKQLSPDVMQKFQDHITAEEQYQ